MKHRAIGKPMSDLSPGGRRFIVLAGIVQVTLAGAAWLDLLRRPAAEVRGPKPAWAAVIAVNFVGPLAYFRWGRRVSPTRGAALRCP